MKREKGKKGGKGELGKICCGETREAITRRFIGGKYCAAGIGGNGAKGGGYSVQ